MDSPFKTIGLIGKPNHSGAAATLARLHTFLRALGFEVLVEQRTGRQLEDLPRENLVKLVDLGERADLAISILCIVIRFSNALKTYVKYNFV